MPPKHVSLPMKRQAFLKVKSKCARFMTDWISMLLINCNDFSPESLQQSALVLFPRLVWVIELSKSIANTQ